MVRSQKSRMDLRNSQNQKHFRKKSANSNGNGQTTSGEEQKTDEQQKFHFGHKVTQEAKVNKKQNDVMT